MNQNLSLSLLIFILSKICSCQIHRAVNSNDYNLRLSSSDINNFNNNDTFVDHTSRSISSSSSSKISVLLFSIIGSFLVGLTGLLPVFILPKLVTDHEKLTKSIRFKCLIAFAAGTLIGDVFIHLLPETYAHLNNAHTNTKQHIIPGLWIIVGLLTFFLMEKIFPDNNHSAHHIQVNISKLV